MPAFELDPRLQNDTHTLGEMKLCRLLLMNDQRWPWLILVPRIAGLEEIHELDAGERDLLAAETAHVSAALKQATGCEKVNTAALGNIVRQLHIHAVARNEDDDNWPGPVWGHGERQPYAPDQLGEIAELVARAVLGGRERTH